MVLEEKVNRKIEIVLCYMNCICEYTVLNFANTNFF